MDTNLHLLRISNLLRVTIKESSTMQVEFIASTKSAALVKIGTGFSAQYRII